MVLWKGGFLANQYTKCRNYCFIVNDVPTGKYLTLREAAFLQSLSGGQGYIKKAIANLANSNAEREDLLASNKIFCAIHDATWIRRVAINKIEINYKINLYI